MHFKTIVLRSPQEKSILLHQNLEANFSFFDREMVAHRSYVAVVEGDAIVGLVCLVEASMRIPGALGVGFIETHCQHRHRGIAKALVRGLFAFAREQGKAIANTPYEEDGARWLAPLMQATAQHYPDVVLHER